MLTIGLDVHQRRTAVCILNENGRRIKRHLLSGGPHALVRYLKAIRQPAQVCFEASCGSGTLHDLLKDVVERIVVAHPGHLRLIYRSKKKNDRVDAEKLAQLLVLEQVSAVHMPSRSVRAWRELILHRSRTVAKRTRAKNGLRALFRSLLIQTPKSLWTRAGHEWMQTIELPDDSVALRRDQLLDEVAFFDRQIAQLERELNRIARTQPSVRLLRTIPGIGPRTAEAVCAFIDDPSRFGTKQIGAYFGLVPSQDQSGAVNRLGRITRQGPPVVRRLVTEAVWIGIRHSPRLRAYFDRITRGDKRRNKIAVIATAHYLTRVMLAMLQTGETWREEQDTMSVAA